MKLIGLWAVAAAWAVVSCGPSDRYWGVYDLPNGVAWLPTQNVVFELTTMAGRGEGIELFVRTEARRGGEPLRLVVKTSRTNGEYWQDTVELRPTATWGAVYEARAVVRRGVRWGAWEPIGIGVRPADGPQEGVLGVGLAVDGAAAREVNSNN